MIIQKECIRLELSKTANLRKGTIYVCNMPFNDLRYLHRKEEATIRIIPVVASLLLE